MSSKFSSPLAEKLYDLTLESFQDDDLGDAQTFGWFALFGDELAIQSCDSQGFVDVTTYDTPQEAEAAWSELSDAWSEFNEEDGEI